MIDATDGVLLARSIRGGFGGRVREACTVDLGGTCTIEDGLGERTDTLDRGQFDLLRRICAAPGSANSPSGSTRR